MLKGRERTSFTRPWALILKIKLALLRNYRGQNLYSNITFSRDWFLPF